MPRRSGGATPRSTRRWLKRRRSEPPPGHSSRLGRAPGYTLHSVRFTRLAHPGGTMRAAVCAIVAAIGLAHPALAQSGHDGAAFWKSVQATCNATAAKPPSELGKRIAQTAIGEFDSFGGHKIDANGRLFHFGLTEAEHE